MAILQYTWFKPMDSTKWIRMPMGKTLSKNRITSNIWFKAMDSITWVCLPINGDLSKPISPEPKVEKQSTTKPAHPEPQKILSGFKPFEKETQGITAAQDAEIKRIWAEFYNKREQEAQKKPAHKTPSKREAAPIRIWVV